MAGGIGLRGHAHAAPHLLVVLGGDLVESEGAELRDMRRGAFRVSSSGTAHEIHFGSSGADCLVLEAEGVFWPRIFERAVRGVARSNVFGDGAGIAESLGNIKAVTALAGSPSALIALGRVLATCEPSTSETPPTWLNDAIDLIERGEQRLLRRVALTLKRDRVHFTRALGSWLGFRPAEYRALRRAAAALDLIQRTQAPLAEIAADCGYAHQSHMSRAFRSLFGHAPSHWRC